MKTLAVLAASAILLYAGSGPSSAQSATDLTIDTPQGARHALLFRHGDGPQPTLLVLHGAFTSFPDMAQLRVPCYPSRYLVRIAEMRESNKIARQALDRLPAGPVMVDNRDGSISVAA